MPFLWIYEFAMRHSLLKFTFAFSLANIFREIFSEKLNFIFLPICLLLKVVFINLFITSKFQPIEPRIKSKFPIHTQFSIGSEKKKSEFKFFVELLHFKFSPKSKKKKLHTLECLYRHTSQHSSITFHSLRASHFQHYS